jgi:fatty acid desaturase
MSFAEQYLDSVNIPGNPVLTPLWAPVGLRYHATHHLFPTMSWARPIAAWSEGFPIIRSTLQTTRHSLWDALRRLWQDSRRAGLPPPGGPDPSTNRIPVGRGGLEYSRACLCPVSPDPDPRMPRQG